MARAPLQRHCCRSCGAQTAKWHGQCPQCGAWNALEEAPIGVAALPARRVPPLRPVRLADVASPELERLGTGIGELDRVLGGGLVPGSLVLVGGSPGVGKSTLTAMALGHLAAAGRRTLYVTGEESASQVRLRAQRLGPAALEVPIVAETALDPVLATLEHERPAVCVIDSVQTLRAQGSDAGASPGSVGQVREVASALARVAKAAGIAVLLVGHVTKDGALAGPRALEHLVDCVLQFEGERERTYRTLRALKNRFGAVDDVGVFEMRERGLVEVVDASGRFVSEATRQPGSVVLCAMEGTRPLLVEVQALVCPSELPQPRRVVSGVDRNRLALVLAVLDRHAGLRVGGADVFVNVVGGVRVEEPGADLAVALAVTSALRARALLGAPAGGEPGEDEADEGERLPLACFGELGLTGELRSVAHAGRRVAEAAKFGLGEPLAPPGAGPGARCWPSLRGAVAAALASSRPSTESRPKTPT